MSNDGGPASPNPSARERLYLALLIVALAALAAVVGGLLASWAGMSVAASIISGAGTFAGAFLLALGIVTTFRL